MNATQEQPKQDQEQPTQSKQAGGKGGWKDWVLAGIIIVALAIILSIGNR